MQLDALLVRHRRLHRALALAYRQLPWHSRKIDDLAAALARVEQEIASLHEAIEPRSVHERLLVVPLVSLPETSPIDPKR